MLGRNGKLSMVETVLSGVPQVSRPVGGQEGGLAGGWVGGQVGPAGGWADGWAGALALEPVSALGGPHEGLCSSTAVCWA